MLMILLRGLMPHDRAWVADDFVGRSIKAGKTTVEHDIHVYRLVHIIILGGMIIVISILSSNIIYPSMSLYLPYS